MGHQLNERMRFLEINEETIACLRHWKPMIDEALPSVLNAFYAHIAQWPEAGGMFKNPGMIDQAKNAQIQHWKKITAGEFDESYVASVRRIGHTHNRIGLEPRWYIGGYGFITNRIIEKVSHTIRDGFRKNRAVERADLITALNKAVMLDMDFAISTYLEAAKDERLSLLGNLSGNFEANVGSVIEDVVQTVEELKQVSLTLDELARTTTDKTTLVSQAADQASSNSAGVASASEELSSSIREISSQVQVSSKVSREAGAKAQMVTQAMHALREQTNAITKVTEFINDVAEEINLLALNATIESARAGEAGKGFAVVASEVKNLASQTTRASEEIGSQLMQIQKACAESEEQVSQIAETIDNLNQAVESIAAAVEEQSAATNEIAQNVNVTSNAANQVRDNIGMVAQGALQTTDSSRAMLNATEQLSNKTTELRTQLDRFLSEIKAA
ncbi:MAG: chemotaxis protein [Rickettsiales bacterium]|mgnify:CR=1 FL=1|nr:chemotaxis protein [Rickettsiales bacterium]